MRIKFYIIIILIMLIPAAIYSQSTEVSSYTEETELLTEDGEEIEPPLLEVNLSEATNKINICISNLAMAIETKDIELYITQFSPEFKKVISSTTNEDGIVDEYKISYHSLYAALKRNNFNEYQGMNVDANLLTESISINDMIADVKVDIKIMSDNKIIRKSKVIYKFKFDQFNGDWKIIHYK